PAPLQERACRRGVTMRLAHPTAALRIHPADLAGRLAARRRRDARASDAVLRAAVVIGGADRAHRETGALAGARRSAARRRREATVRAASARSRACGADAEAAGGRKTGRLERGSRRAISRTALARKRAFCMHWRGIGTAQ